jgi:integrase/recombinase XerD
MSDKSITPLRQRMIDDMTTRRFNPSTQKDYLRHVRNFAAFLGRSPDGATAEDVRRYQLHLAQQPIGAATVNAACSALRFFFNVTLDRAETARHLTPVRELCFGLQY